MDINELRSLNMLDAREETSDLKEAVLIDGESLEDREDYLNTKERSRSVQD